MTIQTTTRRITGRGLINRKVGVWKAKQKIQYLTLQEGEFDCFVTIVHEGEYILVPQNGMYKKASPKLQLAPKKSNKEAMRKLATKLGTDLATDLIPCNPLLSAENCIEFMGWVPPQATVPPK